MKPGIPWSVKGIDQQAREAAKDAARRSGMTLGEWLNTLIKEQADEAEQPDPRFRAPPVRPAPPPAPRGGDDISSKLDLLAEQLNRLTREGSETAAARFVPHAVHAAVETQSLSDLIDRVERNEREAAALLGDLVERLERLERLGEELERRPQVELPQRPEDVPGYTALEGAMRNIISHIETSETRTRDTLKSLQDRLASLVARADKADKEEADRETGGPALADLEARVGELARRLAEGETTHRREIETQVGLAVSRLSERIESLKSTGDSIVESARTAATEAVQREAREVEQRLQAAIAEGRKDPNAGFAAADDLNRTIEGLDQRVYDIKREMAYGQDLQTVKLSLEQLAATVAQGASRQPVADLERRLGELALRLENPDPSGQVASHLGKIESRIYDLDARLREVMGSAGESVTWGSFEAELHKVGDRIAAFEKRLDQVSVLDRSVAQLYQSLDDSRERAKSASEQAARDVADRLLAEGRLRAEPSLEIQALEAGLQAVQSSAEGADRRTQETLEAIHETLEHIVSRLSDLEAAEGRTGASENALTRVAPAALHPVAPEPSLFSRPTFERQAEWNEPPASTETPHESVLGGLRDIPVPDFDPGPVPENPAPASASPEFSLEEAEAEAHAPEVREDFIAAARRAAQSGARSQSPILTSLSTLSQRLGAARDDEARPEPSKPRKSRFSLSFLDRKQEPATVAEKPSPTGERSGSSTRRKLILAGLVLLAAVAAYAANRAILSDRAPADRATSNTAVMTGAKVDRESLGLGLAPDLVRGAKQDPIVTQRPIRVAAADPLTTASLSPIHAGAPADRLDHDSSFSAKANAETLPGLEAPLPASAREPVSMPPAEIGAEQLRQAAAAGDPNAEFIIASRYLDGRSISQDLAKAAEWFGRAAEKGLAPAQYRLATLYERGRGVEQSREAARSWYLRAAGKGNVKSMHNLAVLYADSQQATPQFDLAARWFRAAAERGLKDSQYNLAVLNERGLGTVANVEEAYVWYMLAAKQGDTEAGRKGQALEASLQPATLAGLKQRIDEWVAMPAVRQANLVAMVDPAWQGSSDARSEPAADPAPASEDSQASTSSPILFGKALIRRAQELLANRGFDVGSTDGVMGTKTANAVRQFQLQNGLPVNGMVSNDLLRVLETPRG